MAERFFFAVFQISLTLTILVQAQNPSGFISIDCGLVEEQSYTDETTSIYYTSDANFIGSGLSHSISSNYKAISLERQFWNLRSFPEGTRNCYTLKSPQDGNRKHLLRARFMYGNYDGKDFLPEFDIYLGAKWWDTVEFEDASSIITKEIIYVASSDYVHVCLLNTNKGAPFMSVLELRDLNSDAYIVNSLELLARLDLGIQEGKTVRYPDDVYDRIWAPCNSADWRLINTSLSIDKGATSFSFLPLPPSTVMRTAATPQNNSNNIEFRFSPRRNASLYYIYMYFAEIEKHQANQIREFNIFVNGELFTAQPTTPSYLQNLYYLDIINEPWLELWINRTNRSTLPPLFNAIEIYTTKDLLQSETDQNDVDAIINIKSIYGIKRNWQGDPCTPLTYMWDGLNCSYDGSGPHRIISLNLSSSALTGNIALDISNLKLVEYLDLSNNSLTGEVPGFLSQLQFLRVLNLEGNKLSGTIPMELIDSSKNGSLKLRVDGNPNLCSSDSCNKRRKHVVVIPLVASLGGAFMVIASAVAFCIFRRRKLDNSNNMNSYSKIHSELELKKKKFTYAEVLRITNNLGRVIGKGGFGTVYHGYVDDTQVAIKLLTPSAQGYLQFQAEAKLLTRVHHKCLTALVGYCCEGTNMALIYEYMANGDLAQHLSDKGKDFLGWKQRLQVAVDAAEGWKDRIIFPAFLLEGLVYATKLTRALNEGLEYLHNGCKPSIVHRDVKSRNILLNEKFQAKLADFGLSKIFSDEGDTHMSTVVAGTPGYIDPEYFVSNRLNEKSDVFSFGVVLLEIITGQPAIAKTEEQTHITQWAGSKLLEKGIDDIMDPRLQGKFDIDSAEKALDTAMACVASTSMKRPTMIHVVLELKQCLAMEIETSQSSNNSNDVSFDRISGESSLARD